LRLCLECAEKRGLRAMVPVYAKSPVTVGNLRYAASTFPCRSGPRPRLRTRYAPALKCKATVCIVIHKVWSLPPGVCGLIAHKRVLARVIINKNMALRKIRTRVHGCPIFGSGARSGRMNSALPGVVGPNSFGQKQIEPPSDSPSQKNVRIGRLSDYLTMLVAACTDYDLSSISMIYNVIY